MARAVKMTRDFVAIAEVSYAGYRMALVLLCSLGLLICMPVLGLPIALIFTHGMILVPLLILAVLGPFILVHYFLWGWWLAPRREKETHRMNPLDLPNHCLPPRHVEGIRNKEGGESYFRR